jgi:hypothetical protein
MRAHQPRAGEIWEVLLDNGDIVELRRRGLPDIFGGKWDTLDDSTIPSRIYCINKRVD